MTTVLVPQKKPLNHYFGIFKELKATTKMTRSNAFLEQGFPNLSLPKKVIVQTLVNIRAFLTRFFCSITIQLKSNCSTISRFLK